MGQAFDRDGQVLGEAVGGSKREVFEKLHSAHPEAAEVRIKTMGQGQPTSGPWTPSTGLNFIDEIENTFSYHKPFGSQPQRYEHLRTMAKNLAYNIHTSCPPSRERSLALTHLQETIMWANASIAINERDRRDRDIPPQATNGQEPR